MRDQLRILSSLLAAAVVVALALVTRWAMNPFFGVRVPFFTFFPAAFAAAWWGGLWPALLATILSTLVMAYFVMPPLHSFAIEYEEQRIGMILFAVLGLFSGFFGEQLHKARRQAADDRDKAVDERERLRVTLATIGDGVIVTDDAG